MPPTWNFWDVVFKGLNRGLNLFFPSRERSHTAYPTKKGKGKFIFKMDFSGCMSVRRNESFGQMLYIEVLIYFFVFACIFLKF